MGDRLASRRHPLPARAEHIGTDRPGIVRIGAVRPVRAPQKIDAASLPLPLAGSRRRRVGEGACGSDKRTVR